MDSINNSCIRKVKHFFGILLVQLLFILTSCVNMTSTEFNETLTLDDLQGVYCNYGDRNSIYTGDYLSRIIWPGDNILDHDNIDNIKVSKSGNKTLVVEARWGNTTLKSGKFVEDKDFSIKNGRIKLKARRVAASSRASSGGGASVGIEARELGLDKEGHGRLESGGIAVGAVSDIELLPIPFLVLPVVGKEDVRFKRLTIEYPEFFIQSSLDKQISIEKCRWKYEFLQCYIKNIDDKKIIQADSVNAILFNMNDMVTHRFTVPDTDLGPGKMALFSVYFSKSDERTNIKIQLKR